MSDGSTAEAARTTQEGRRRLAEFGFFGVHCRLGGWGSDKDAIRQGLADLDGALDIAMDENDPLAPDVVEVLVFAR